MHNEDLPSGFLGSCRLFPLPGLVLFPHAILPLHIFEPRYRQMTEDALATDHLITMIQIKSEHADRPEVEPKPIEAVGCLGRIIRYERMIDGRFNLLLVGLRRVRLQAELAVDKLYRVASAEVIEDLPCVGVEQSLKKELIRLFRERFDPGKEIDSDLRKLLDSESIGLGALTDIIAHALVIPSHVKQNLLEEPSVDRRVELLRFLMNGGEKASGLISMRSFPPPFSLN